jgi:hypothetical protein
MVVAFPVTMERMEHIRQGALFHVTYARNGAQIIKSKIDDKGDGPNFMIDLQAAQGWSVTPFRLLRDYSVLDPHLGETRTWGQYTYFFLGAPSTWAVKKNIGLAAVWGKLGADKSVIEIKGTDLLQRAQHVFFRPDDSVVVIRGGYTGPARIDPAP